MLKIVNLIYFKPQIVSFPAKRHPSSSFIVSAHTNHKIVENYFILINSWSILFLVLKLEAIIVQCLNK